MNFLSVFPLFADGMVIQREESIPVWGNAGPAAKVKVSFNDKEYNTLADDNGKWSLTLDSQSAGGPYIMEICTPETNPAEKICIKDIYCGDVWLCGGQSNMEMPMQRLRDEYPEEWDLTSYPVIRQFKIPQEWDFAGPRENFTGGKWICASKENLDSFSGVAWFYAKKINEKYDIPVGLINTAWGGTPVEAWMSREALAEYPVKIAQGDQYKDPKNIAINNEKELTEWAAALNSKDCGLIEEWQNPKTDIFQWKEIFLPGDFKKAGLENFCGVLWLCREIEIKPENRAQRVNLGTIIDADTVYINGTEIGNTTYRYPPRKYEIPADILQEGKNRIVIRVTCNSGDGGVTIDKPFQIDFENGFMDLSGIWKYKIGQTAEPRPAEFFFHRQPMGLFNAIINPVLPFLFKGVIWYQGESNEGNSDEYEELFNLMIKDWRKKTDRGDFPFLFVQLPIYGNPGDNNENSSWAKIREAQYAALSLANTGMAAGLELGEWNDIHPINKKGIGLRLYHAAEKLLNKIENTSPGPVLRSMERKQNNLLLVFDNCGQGLAASETPYVSVVTDNGIVRLPAEIIPPDVLSADISVVKNPKKVLYAWANNPIDRQLFNSENLPALPFNVEIN